MKLFELSLVTCEKIDCPLQINPTDNICGFCGMAVLNYEADIDLIEKAK
jgi:hypothetical protein